MKAMTQRGFSLIELMIVVAIIGILAAIALPAYEDYIVRVKVSEAILAASACKTTVSETFLSAPTLPGSGGVNWGCSASMPSLYVANVGVVSGGEIGATLHNIAQIPNGAAIRLVPYADDTTLMANAPGGGLGMEIYKWSCGAVNVPPQYLPGSCRDLS